MRAAGKLNDRHLWLATAFEHELRHFHDSLLSSSWLTMLALRNQCVFNFQSLMRDFAMLQVGSEATCLPLPLRKWLHMSQLERERRASVWRNLADNGQSYKALPMPLLPLPDPADKQAVPIFWPTIPDDISVSDRWGLAVRFDFAVMGHARVAEINRGRAQGKYGFLKPLHIYELSAMLAQLMSAHATFDETAPNDLIRSLGQSPGNYGELLIWFLSFLITCCGVDAKNVMTVASTAATWALIGPPDLIRDQHGRDRSEREIMMSCPAARMAFALEEFEIHGLTTDNPSDLLLHLDNSAGSMGYVEAIDWVTTSLIRRAKQYREMSAQIAERTELRLVSEMIEFIISQRLKIVRRFLRDPNDYIVPHLYHEVINEFPDPPLRFDFAGREFPLLYKGEEGEVIENGVFDGFQEADGTRIKSWVLHVPDGLRREALFAYENLQVFTDFHLTGVAPPGEAETLRAFWSGQGMPVMNI
jgi:hypothetical protein